MQCIEKFETLYNLWTAVNTITLSNKLKIIELELGIMHNVTTN